MFNIIEKCKFKTSYLVFILFIPFLCVFNDINTHNIDALEMLFELLRLTSAAIVFFMFFFIKKKKPSKLATILLIWEIWQLFVTCFTTKKIVVSIYDLAAAVAIPLLIEMFLDEPKELIKGLILAYEIAVYLNFPSFFLYPGKLLEYERTFMLGYYCVVIQFFLPAIGVAIMNLRTNAVSKMRSYILIVISTISIILSWSGTNKAMMLACVGVILLGLLLRKFNLKVPLTGLFLLTLFGSVFVIYIFKPGVFGIIDWFLINVLHKSTTFTGRTEIWEVANRLIVANPLFGNGFRTKILTDSGWMAGHAHNAFLDKTLVGGIPLLLMFIAFNMELGLKVDKYKNDLYRLLMISLVFGVMITYITESYLNFYRFFSLIFLTYHLEKISSNQDYK